MFSNTLTSKKAKMIELCYILRKWDAKSENLQKIVFGPKVVKGRKIFFRWVIFIVDFKNELRNDKNFEI